MKKILSSMIAFIAMALLIFALLFTSLQYVINDEGWFYRQYTKLELEKEIGIPTNDIVKAWMRLIDYMEDREGSIDLNVSENGREVSMYNDQERAHMVDVKALYKDFADIRAYGIIAAIALIVLICILMKRDALRTLGGGFIASTWLLMGIFLAVGVWMLIDFNSFWTRFHYLFFTNDLWLMDYATCRMIRICPAKLFFNIIVRFALLFLIPMAALYIVSRGVRRAAYRRDKREERETLEEIKQELRERSRENR